MKPTKTPTSRQRCEYSILKLFDKNWFVVRYGQYWQCSDALGLARYPPATSMKPSKYDEQVIFDGGVSCTSSTGAHSISWFPIAVNKQRCKLSQQ